MLEETTLKEIGILEIHTHVKYLHTLAKICKTKKSNVTIFTTKDIFSKLETYLKNKSEYEIVLKKEREGISSFLKRVKKICNEKIDLLFVNTFQLSCFYLPRYIGFHPKSKMILTVHTANAWLKPKPVCNIKKIVRTIDTNLSSFIASKFILPKFAAITVIYSPIKDYILKEGAYEKKIFTLPFYLFDDNNIYKETENKRMQIVIPGQIEEHRRDYDTILDAFEVIFKKYNELIDLCLLGYPVGMYGNRILKRCKELKDAGYNIAYFDSFVPEKVYDQIMKKVDVIVLPIKIETRGMGLIQEFYGITKGSASVFEGIQYGKPMVVPEEFNVIKELKSSTLKYANSNNLEKILIEYIEDKNKLKVLKKNANENAKHFSLDVFQKYFVDEILDNLDNL